MPCARSWPPSKNKWTGCKIFSSAACTDVDTYLSRSATLKKRTAELKASLSAAEDMAHRTSADHIVAQVHKLTSGLEAYAGMDVQGKNRLLRSIIQSGTYYKEKGWSPTHFELEITLK